MTEKEWLCPNAEKIEVCPQCSEWTGVCSPCCPSTFECEYCDGDGNPIQEESA